MRAIATLAVATASISGVAALAVPRPWIHEDAQYRHLTSRNAYPSGVVGAAQAYEPTPADTEKTMHLSIRDTYPFGTAEGGKYRPHPHEPNPDEYGVDTYVKGIKYRPYPYEPGVHGHDEYLPGPGPHTQEEIDAAVHYVSPPDTVTKEDLDSIPADAETRLQLLHRSTDPVGAGEDKKHHLHSHEDYLEELDRTYRLHGHDEYLEGSGAGAAEIPEPTSGDAKEVLDDKVQRRCIWGQSCQDICTMGGLVGLIGCTWNCGGDVNMPTCPESGDIEA